MTSARSSKSALEKYAATSLTCARQAWWFPDYAVTGRFTRSPQRSPHFRRRRSHVWPAASLTCLRFKRMSLQAVVLAPVPKQTPRTVAHSPASPRTWSSQVQRNPPFEIISWFWNGGLECLLALQELTERR